MRTFFYVYVLRSVADGRFYTGYTQNLRNRFTDHQNGVVAATKHRLPVELVYYEGCLDQQDATHREKYLKTAWGKRYIKTRLKRYLTG